MEIFFFLKKKAVTHSYVYISRTLGKITIQKSPCKYPLDRITNSSKIYCIIMFTNCKAMYKNGWK